MTDAATAVESAGRGEEEVVKLSLMRRAMARRLAEAALVPCFYLRRTADVSGLFDERARLRGRLDSGVGRLVFAAPGHDSLRTCLRVVVPLAFRVRLLRRHVFHLP